MSLWALKSKTYPKENNWYCDNPPSYTQNIWTTHHIHCFTKYETCTVVVNDQNKKNTSQTMKHVQWWWMTKTRKTLHKPWNMYSGGEWPKQEKHFTNHETCTVVVNDQNKKNTSQTMKHVQWWWMTKTRKTLHKPWNMYSGGEWPIQEKHFTNHETCTVVVNDQNKKNTSQTMKHVQWWWMTKTRKTLHKPWNMYSGGEWPKQEKHFTNHETCTVVVNDQNKKNTPQTMKHVQWWWMTKTRKTLHKPWNMYSGGEWPKQEKHFTNHETCTVVVNDQNKKNTSQTMKHVQWWLMTKTRKTLHKPWNMYSGGEWPKQEKHFTNHETCTVVVNDQYKKNTSQTMKHVQCTVVVNDQNKKNTSQTMKPIQWWWMTKTRKTLHKPWNMYSGGEWPKQEKHFTNHETCTVMVNDQNKKNTSQTMKHVQWWWMTKTRKTLHKPWNMYSGGEWPKQEKHFTNHETCTVVVNDQNKKNTSQTMKHVQWWWMTKTRKTLHKPWNMYSGGEWPKQEKHFTNHETCTVVVNDQNKKNTSQTMKHVQWWWMTNTRKTLHKPWNMYSGGEWPKQEKHFTNHETCTVVVNDQNKKNTPQTMKHVQWWWMTKTRKTLHKPWNMYSGGEWPKQEKHFTNHETCTVVVNDQNKKNTSQTMKHVQWWWMTKTRKTLHKPWNLWWTALSSFMTHHLADLQYRLN